MGRFTRYPKAAPLALLGLLAFTPHRQAVAGPATDDNDELVAGSEFEGFPDQDTHSGVFCDITPTGSSPPVQPAPYRSTVPASHTPRRVAVFHGQRGPPPDPDPAPG